MNYSNTSVGAHGWSNITVYAYNNSGGGSLSSPETNYTQLANNAPVQELLGNQAVTAGKLLTFTVSASDADLDQITYGTKATVRSGGIAVGGVTVSTNTSIMTTTDASGFYSLPVTAGAYQLTAAREPVYYTNSSVTLAVVSGVVVRDIELLIKPTGTITGSVTNA